MDTILGLSRLPIDFPSSDLKATSLWHNIVKQKLLKRNMFSIKLSTSVLNLDGEIMFGGVNNDLFEGELTSLPIVDPVYALDLGHTSNFFDSGWQVDVQSLAFGTVEADLSGYIAVFPTLYPYIDLPSDLWNQFKETYGFDEEGLIKCSARETLPNFVVRLGPLGGDVKLTITAWSYVREMAFPDKNETFCLLAWQNHAEVEGKPKYIILGAPFLKGVYSVFDQDEATISCEWHSSH